MNHEFVKSFKNTFMSKSVAKNILYILVFAFLLLVCASYVYILVWGFLAGLKDPVAAVKSPFAWSWDMHFENYINVFTMISQNSGNIGFAQMLFNSLFFSLLGPFISLTLTSMIAYVTCKFKFPGSNIFYPIVMITITLPLYGTGGSAYKLYYNLGFIDSYSYIITSTSGLGVNYLYFFAVFKGLSWSYAEAAYIDGANDYTVYFKVMFPLIFNLYGALFLLSWLSAWNDYSSVLIYLPKLPTLAGGIYLFSLTAVREAQMNLLYAAYILSAIPPIVLFGMFNKVMMSNISLGGIKE